MLLSVQETVVQAFLGRATVSTQEPYIDQGLGMPYMQFLALSWSMSIIVVHIRPSLLTGLSGLRCTGQGCIQCQEFVEQVAALGAVRLGGTRIHTVRVKKQRMTKFYNRRMSAMSHRSIMNRWLLITVVTVSLWGQLRCHSCCAYMGDLHSSRKRGYLMKYFES